ncbi:hotdog fold thioesterase [Virgibacillus salexigens]|uniref:hotdog fold thioesterase n=1 Tax=Virgibacillus massiliensis TaxID=1462526 RepID=UPI001369DBD1|nr:hotdog fold thioesterase [Virgibacillus massiliensis]MYL40021.1 hotdog fold thioesterase [Virgibacillus massiliensis]
MRFNDTLMEVLGIQQISLTKDKVILSMPVDKRTHQPYGYLHGGASVALAETAASIGASLHADPQTKSVFGMEINANHIRSKRSGMVTATATPLHTGKTSMVWDIRITDEQANLISVSRCTIGIVSKRKETTESFRKESSNEQTS